MNFSTILCAMRAPLHRMVGNQRSAPHGTPGAAMALRHAVAARAAVCGYLFTRGVVAENIGARDFGESRSTVSNDTPQNRALNHRVEIEVSQHVR